VLVAPEKKRIDAYSDDQPGNGTGVDDMEGRMIGFLFLWQ